MLMKESLSGNCKTSLVVTVVEDNVMSNETTSSLRFGLSCGKISQKNVSKQQTVDTSHELPKLQNLLERLNKEIADLES